MKQSNVELDERVAVSHRRVRVSMHAAKSCLMQDKGQSAEGQEGQKHTVPRSCPSSRESAIQSVLNPSGAFVPGPGKCGGEGRQRWRGGHKCTPPDLKGEKETHSGKYIQQKPYHLPGFPGRLLKSYSILKINAEVSVTGSWQHTSRWQMPRHV